MVCFYSDNLIEIDGFLKTYEINESYAHQIQQPLNYSVKKQDRAFH